MESVRALARALGMMIRGVEPGDDDQARAVRVALAEVLDAARNVGDAECDRRDILDQVELETAWGDLLT